MQEKRASEPLSIDQFLSAFLLLVLGKLLILALDSKILTLFAIVLPSGTISSLCLLLLEHIYVRYVRKMISNNHDTSKPGYCVMDKAGLFLFRRNVGL